MQLSEKFMKNIRDPIKFKIGGYEFELKPLPNKFTPQVMTLIKHLTIARKDMPEELSAEKRGEYIIGKLDVFTWELINSLLSEDLKLSYPEEPEDGLKQFISSNFMELINPFLIINTGVKIDEHEPDTNELGQNTKENS